MYCLACRQGFRRSEDGLEHVHLDGTHHSWCERARDRDICVELGTKRPRLHAKPLGFDIAPGRAKIMPPHRQAKAKLRRLERELNKPPAPEILYLSRGKVRFIR